MKAIRTIVGKGGRVVIPAELRRAAGIEEAEPVLIRVVDGEVRIYTLSTALRRVQEHVRTYIPEGRMLSEELIADRRREAAAELAEDAMVERRGEAVSE